MKPRPLTTWEQKERDGLLALETEEWREKRLVAEDPNTTADGLERLGEEIIAAWKASIRAITITTQIGKQPSASYRNLLRQQNEPGNLVEVLVVEAIMAHPNAPPKTLLRLLETIGRYVAVRNHLVLLYDARARGLCANSVTPFVVLETPDFWQRLPTPMLQRLLLQESLPVPVAWALTRHAEDRVAEAARLHVSVAGKLRTKQDGLTELRRTWKTHQSKESLKQKIARSREKIAQIRALPTSVLPRPLRWAVCLITIGMELAPREPCLLFAGRLQRRFRSPRVLQKMGTSSSWKERLNAASVLPDADRPFSDDLWGRSPLHLLQHLACDGNRFVRWAAQTRLDDPDFVFTWYEE